MAPVKTTPKPVLGGPIVKPQALAQSPLVSGPAPKPIRPTNGGIGLSGPVVITHLPPKTTPPRLIVPHPILSPHSPKPHNTGYYEGGWRYGYWTYLEGLYNDVLCYGSYQEDPCDEDQPEVSPWYFYPNLPPFIEHGQTTPIDPDELSDPWDSTTDFAAPSPTTPAVDQAFKTLIAAWTKEDVKAMAELAPMSGEVEVRVGGTAQYNLSASDFADLLHDGIANTKTQNYKIVGMKQINPTTLDVKAEHDFLDPWGVPRTIYHTYKMVLENGAYVIRGFSSGSYS